MREHPKIPKYWKLAESLRAQIESGALASGARLPSVAQAQAQHGVSLSTVTQAHALLEKEGLIVREQGRGTFVAENALRATPKVGLVLHSDWAGSSYDAEWLAGVREEAERQNFELSWLRDADVSDRSRADAILFYCHLTEALALSLPSQTPHVLLFQHTPDLTCVSADDFAGAKLATQHLLELGHRRIACLLSSNHDSISRRRLAGYRAALKKAGLTEKETVRFLSRKTRAQSYRAASEAAMALWLGDDWKKLGCTAIVAHNDETAIGVIKALREHGLRVPEDVSVAGFDGTELSDLSTPSLTTVRVPLHEIGAMAVRVLAQQIQKGIRVQPQEITLPVQLKIGASTAPVSSKRKEAVLSVHQKE